MTDFKINHLKVTGVFKNPFLSVLRKCLNVMVLSTAKMEHQMGDAKKKTIKKILRNGFKACGIVSFNPNKILSKVTPINSNVNKIIPLIKDSLIDYLQNKKLDIVVVKK